VIKQARAQQCINKSYKWWILFGLCPRVVCGIDAAYNDSVKTAALTNESAQAEATGLHCLAVTKPHHQCRDVEERCVGLGKRTLHPARTTACDVSQPFTLKTDMHDFFA